MHAIDLGVLVVYLAATIWLGIAWAGRHVSAREYFLAGRRIPWWVLTASIVATETSTVTFISIPGLAYATDFTFLQLVLGYLLGRVAVSLIFVPAYFRGELVSVYQLLQQRFGATARTVASGLFLVTRTLADGFRLFATGLVLAALLGSSAPIAAAAERLTWLEPATALVVLAVILIGGVTVAYTYLGGMAAVLWTDLVQLCVYLGGAVAAALIIVGLVPGGWPEILAAGDAAGKFRVFDFTVSLDRHYTFWSGVIGGAFLTTATHGTDQLMVQRLLCADSARHARRALLVSGVVVLGQFVLFLLIGAMLFVYYTEHAPAETAAFTLGGVLRSDRVFPEFIVSHLPPGLVGLVCAAVFAAAMSTLSSSLNSSAAATLVDFLRPGPAGRSPRAELRLARGLTALWGVAQVLVAILAIRLSGRVVDEVLGIASFTNGVLLGVFLLGTLTGRIRERAVLTGMVAGIVVMLGVRVFTAIVWQWYVLIGTLATVVTAVAANALTDTASRPGGPLAR